jgi:hypothetical protein
MVEDTSDLKENDGDTELKLNGRTPQLREMFKDPTDWNYANLRNGVKLTMDYSFGALQTPIDSNAVFVSDDNIVYPSGRHLVMYDLNTEKSEFIQRELPDSREVTCMATGFTKKKELMVIVGERVFNKPPWVCIYYPSRSKWQYFPHSHVGEDYTVTFTEINKRYLVTLATCPGKGSICSYFRVDKDKDTLSRTVELPSCVCKVASYKDSENLQFVAIGKNYLKLFDARSKDIKERRE